MNVEQREEIKSEVEEELNLKLNGDGTPMNDEELAALAEASADSETERDNVTEESSQIRYTKEDSNIEII